MILKKYLCFDIENYKKIHIKYLSTKMSVIRLASAAKS